MLKSIENLKGVKKLSKQEQNSISAGDGWTITCNFPDGQSWSGHSDDIEVAAGMMVHCGNSGGSESHEYFFFTDFINHF